MATIVVTSEEDPALSIVRFTSELAWADAGPEVAEPQVARLCMEAQEFIAMGRWFDLASLLVTSADLIFSRVSEKDLECIFTIICSLVTKSESMDEALEMAKLISTKVSQQSYDKPALRLKILFNLYNLLENPYSKFYVYMKALNLAVNCKVTEHIIPSFRKMDSFLKEWNIGNLDQRELFLIISNILKEHKSSAKDSFYFLTKYLVTFSGEDAYMMSEAKGKAVRAIVEFVKAPDMFQSDLLDMLAVGQLEKDDKYALVYQLLKIFLTQRLDAYLDFHAANSTLLKSYGLVHEDCITKMRLMTLADLGTDYGEIPYALIKDTLRVNDDEVELWVVKAINTKLLDCKMDQINQVVIVNLCMECVFGLHQWLALRSKLATWRGSIANVLNTIQANKVTEEGAQAAQGIVIR
ncbi:eukaryotic translation initiation factor 3 subunit M-like isoform X2 [Telopea speciosissima]|uniref:eukaryotic translation initiation factor 3 subunit M-like isoform X2 n=1 Tax=Telopea speciosissima TaxID=54955 RepID=UPI001CC50F0B|nr:eukaryotic translation initiation factor 3 subunit M-like isoform X2 [Telopea speciosissima]